MITTQQLELGIGDYLDTELVPKLPSGGWQRILICTALSIGVKKISKFVDELKEMPFITAIDIVDSNGNIDIDVIADALKSQIPESGFSVSNNKFGNYQLTFHKDDVDALYKCIQRRVPVCSPQPPIVQQPIQPTSIG